MKIIITGADGRVGSTLACAFRGTSNVDLHEINGFDTIASVDLALAQNEMATVVYHCAGNANPGADLDQHYQTVTLASHVLGACSRHEVEKVYLCGSMWDAPPQHWPNSELTRAYGAAKRAIKEMAAAYRPTTGFAKYVRIGWFPNTPLPEGASEEQEQIYWSRGRLLDEFGVPLLLGLLSARAA